MVYLWRKLTAKLVAYEISTGQKLWENDSLLNRQLSNPVMLGQDLIVGDLDGVLHMLNPATGELTRSCEDLWGSAYFTCD